MDIFKTKTITLFFFAFIFLKKLNKYIQHIPPYPGRDYHLMERENEFEEESIETEEKWLALMQKVHDAEYSVDLDSLEEEEEEEEALVPPSKLEY